MSTVDILSCSHRVIMSGVPVYSCCCLLSFKLGDFDIGIVWVFRAPTLRAGGREAC